ncbi:hypothetical protein MAR_021512, partial [Mya arenaria]
MRSLPRRMRRLPKRMRSLPRRMRRLPRRMRRLPRRMRSWPRVKELMMQTFPISVPTMSLAPHQKLRHLQTKLKF